METNISQPDPFDLAGLRLRQDFIETAGVKKLLTTVPARKPGRQDFIRVHPSPDYRGDFGVIDLKDDGEIFLVTAGAMNELAGETVNVTLFTAITRQGVVFLWPVRLPSPDDRQLEWWRSAREAAERAMGGWLRVTANKALGGYEMCEALGSLAEPQWPEASFQELIRIAFRDRLVNSTDHPVVRRLRGLA